MAIDLNALMMQTIGTTATPAAAAGTTTAAPVTGTANTAGTPAIDAAGNIDWSKFLSGAMNVGFGLNDLFGSGSSSASGQMAAAAAAADPFAGQRGQYQTMLQGLMTDPSKFNLSPAAQAQMEMGTENLQRAQAAKGFLGSGNILGELQKYGQNVASQDYWNQLNQLNLLSGVQAGSPSTAGAILGDLYGAKQLARTSTGTGLGSLLGTGAGGTSALGSLISGGGNLLSSVLSGLGGLFGGSSDTSGVDWSSILGGGSGSSALDQIGASLGGGTGVSDVDLWDQIFGGGTAGAGTGDLQSDLGLGDFLTQQTYSDTGSVADALGFY